MKKHAEDIREIVSRVKETAMNLAITKVLIHRGRKAVRDMDDNSKRAISMSEELLMRLLDENKDTEYGKLYDFAHISSIEEYKEKVPLSTYDDYEPYIKRMVEDDEKNLLTVRPPKHYALSSGSVGVPKHIPVSGEELDIYSKYGTSLCFGVMDEFYRNTTGSSIKPGFGVNCIELKFQDTKHGVPKGAISGNIMKQVKDISGYILTSPWDVINPKAEMDLKYLRARFALERDDVIFLLAAFMTALVDMTDYIRANWKMLCKDIYYGRIDDSIKIPDEQRRIFEQQLSPNPRRAKKLAAEFRKGSDGILTRIWPDLQFVAGIGTGGFFTYAKKMRRYTGKNIPYNNLTYAASEGLFAAARHAGDTSYVLLPEGGFYEFIPANAEDETNTLTIDQLEEGEEYEIVVTNLSGCYRYRIKDVIRVTGFYNEAPLLQFIYRKSQMLSIQGEKTNEESVRWSIEQFMKDTKLVINDYSVYADTDSEPGHYVFLMEPDTRVPKEKIAEYRDVIDAKMSQANPSYGDKVRTGVLGPMELIFLQAETYQAYRDLMIRKGTSANQLKPVRVIDTPIKKKFFFTLKERY